MENNKLTTEQELEIINKRNQGVLIKYIKVEYNIKSNKTIYDIIKRNGRDKIIANKKYEVDSSYFENIDSEEKAYWLGFLYADGYVRMHKGRSGELKLKLAIKDKQHIELFKKCIKSTHLIKDLISDVTVDGIKHTSMCSSLSIYNTKLVNDLFKHGCVNNKTFKIIFPELEQSLIRHFLRGYFDGDGCISKRKYTNSLSCCITSNLFFIKDIQKYIGFGKINKVDNIYNLVFYDRKKIESFYYLLYNNSTIFLERKKIIFQHLDNL